MFLKYILFAHRNDYCKQMLLSGKTEVASPEKCSGHNQSRFRAQEYDRIPPPNSIFYSELHRYVVFSGSSFADRFSSSACAGHCELRSHVCLGEGTSNFQKEKISAGGLGLTPGGL